MTDAPSHSGNATYHCDVLIAGLGPVGATLAALLGRAGLDVMVVEPEPGIYPLPRAAHVDHEIMRIFQAIGIADAIAGHVRPAPNYEFRTTGGETLIQIEREGIMGASGWPVAFNIHQPGIEEAIREALTQMPAVRTLFGARFTDLIRNDRDGVVAAIDIVGAAETVSARFLVGCDGAWSPVREACGIALQDYVFDEPWLVLDALVPDESGFPPINLQVCDPQRPTTFVHMGPGRLRWEFMLKPGEEAEAMKADAAVETLLAPWRPLGDIRVERRAVYRFHGLVADRWRQDSVFIAGDAAHQMPPFMGQGLCSGLRDVANLAWKLEAAIGGFADDSLLDTYQTERNPHVRFVIERAIAMGRVVCTLDPERAAARDVEMLAAPKIGRPVVFPAFASGCILPGVPAAGEIFPQPIDPTTGDRLDDILGSGAWLLYRQGADTSRPVPGVRAVAIENLAPAFAEAVRVWLASFDAEAVLVRPDRIVFGTGPRQMLASAYVEFLSPEPKKAVSPTPARASAVA